MLPSLVDGHHYREEQTFFIFWIEGQTTQHHIPEDCRLIIKKSVIKTWIPIHLVILLYDYHMHDITHIQDTNGNVSQHHIVLVNASAAL